MEAQRMGFFMILLCLPALGQQEQRAPDRPSPTETTSSDTSSPSNEISPAIASKPSPALDLTPDAHGALSQEQMRTLVRVVVDNYRDNYKKQRDYTYIDHEITHKIDSKGQVKSSETKTYEIMDLYGEPVPRLIEKDDKPLNEKDAAKEEEKIQKLIDKRRDESESERNKRLAEKEKARQKTREFLGEVADAYNFRLVGSELLNEREAWLIEGEPRPEFHTQIKDAQMLSKFHGRLWIDKREMQLAKMDIEAIDTVSFGWVLARIHKGTRFVYEQTRVNDEVWLPQHYEAKVDARIALFKSDNELDEGTYHDYKKFRTSAKIIGFGEVKEK
jgi:hypothetical protein